MRGRLSDVQPRALGGDQKGFVRVQRMGSGEDDPATRLTGQLSMVSEHLEGIGENIDRAVEKAASRPAAPSVDPDLWPRFRRGHAGTSRRPARPLTVHRKAARAPRGVRERSKAASRARRRAPAPSRPADYELISRESYLIEGTLIPLMRFMAHRFRGYRGVDDPNIKALISKLEYVDDIPELVEALEKINVSALSNMIDDEEADADEPAP